MKKTRVIALSKYSSSALRELAKLGVLHVEIIDKKDSDDRSSLEQRLSKLDTVFNVIASQKSSEKSIPAKFADMTGKELFEESLSATENLSYLEKKLDGLLASREKLLPWGNFDRFAIESLEKRGLHVYLCRSTHEIHEKLKDKYTCEIVRDGKHTVFFAVLSTVKIDDGLLPLSPIPSDMSLDEVENSIKSCSEDLRKTKSILSAMKHKKSELSMYRGELASEIELLLARDGMGARDSLVCIGGYVPEPSIALLRKAASENGWGLILEDPSPTDTVPTLIKYPAITRIAKPIFDFIGVDPGYDEWDVSACFLLFFTIFFAMIVADAGYGTLFIIAAIFLKMKFKDRKELKLPINLFMVLSCATIFWGLLTGSVFSIPSEHLPSWMCGLKIFTDPAIKDKNIQLVCFLLAACHLSFARLWKAIIFMNIRSLGQIGWAVMIWANFFTISGLIVYEADIWKYTYILYIVAIALLLLFYVDWKNMGDVFNFPFTLIGSFTDVLSYIRLYAVGLSSYYVAMNTNDLGLMLMTNPYMTVIGILLIFTGHVGNIVLSFLGVLVHGIRLNTLEFSNHMELQWKGFSYKPLKITEKT